MTALPLRDFSDAEKARLNAIEAAPAAEESVRERVAEALYEVTEAAEYHEWPDVTGVVQNYVYTLADAAIDVLRGPSSDAERAVERVLDLADEWEGNASVRDFGLSYLVAADRLRSVVAAAVDGAR